MDTLLLILILTNEVALAGIMVWGVLKLSDRQESLARLVEHALLRQADEGKLN